ncbi:MAG: terminase small subunit [Candidatus Gastranaerophilales bacterium]|nr:terminase small subunit [Candidatus Gastranaerophilales bacterium]
MNELPKLTEKQQKFVLRYLINGNNATEAYKFAYDCKKMSDVSINTEASKLLKNPKVTLWFKYAQNNIQQVFQEEIIYSALDCFNELERIRDKTEDNNKTVSVALKAVELKGKLAGHFVDKHEVKADRLTDVLDKLT